MQDTGMVTTGQETSDASTETQSTESTGQGQVESQGSQGQTETAGDSQGFSEGGKEQGTDTRRPQQFRSKNQTIYELRQKIREQQGYWENEVGTLKTQLAEIQKMFGRGQERKPSRTFWEAPEEVLDERITGHLSEMEKRIIDHFQNQQKSTQETTQWKQETSEATKLIRSQKDLTEDDILEITELIREHPSMEKMRPTERAEYALYLYGKQRGVSDKSALKAKAHVPAGSPATGKPRTYTEAELESEVNKLGDPKHWNEDQKKQYDLLEREIRQAYKDGRVKK